MGAYIETEPLDLTVLGQVQRAYVVDGQPGLALDVACMASTFKRVISLETEMTAMGDAVKRRGAAMQAYGKALGEISAAVAYIGKNQDDVILKDGNVNAALTKAKKLLEDAKLGTGMFSVFNGSQIKVNDLRKLRESVKYQADQESNALQRNSSMLQGVLNKRDTAVSLVSRLRKRLDKTMMTSIRNIGG